MQIHLGNLAAAEDPREKKKKKGGIAARAK
jgi:hypothetical protein